MTYKLSNKSLKKLEGVHPDLVRVVKRAITLSKVDFLVNEGVRSSDRQKELVASNKSHTMHSKHMVQEDGYSYAVDLLPYPVNWNIESFFPIAEAMQLSAKELGVKIRWGGCWCSLNQESNPKALLATYVQSRKQHKVKVFIDAPHFELIVK